MARIKIKTNKDPRLKNTKLDLLKILYPNGVLEARDGVVITTYTDQEVDKILEPGTTATPEKHGFSPILPPEVKARRTIICFRVDEIAFDYSPDIIADEIEERQGWAKVKTVFKFQNSTGKRNTLKIESETVSMADKATREGIRLFNVSIAPHQTGKERYTRVDFCMKFYVIEKHSTRQCPQTADYKV